ncbi:hypothetical protein B0A48_18586 [Cryoendolithus antarcticus]|uniref:Reverse transcriptase domain-containing protein n=1 Tax=Cryoendolithus antarcticus TaxID=1507870 RepID=A0A1V8S807_9PEZI|nr:hypothetical protein B0A48_18586 [Cryoendolithus antarcticus]
MGYGEVTEEREEADLLLTSFFHMPPISVRRDQQHPSEAKADHKEWQQIHTIEAAITQSKSDKAPGLDEITFHVWKEFGGVLSLVSFDVQGAFNGVHSSMLVERLRERRTPGDLVAWIERFCNGRKASVVWSPLSPILYVFYNANLVQGRSNKSEVSIGFIDDCNAWVTEVSAVENTRTLQMQLLPGAEKRARERGTTTFFEIDPAGVQVGGDACPTKRSEVAVAVQLCRYLPFQGTYLYYAAVETQHGQCGAAAIIKYRMTTGMVKHPAIVETSTCSPASAKLTAELYALEHARDALRKTARVYVAIMSREAPPAIEKGHKVRGGREVVHKITDTILEMEGVVRRATIFLVPSDQGMRGVAEAKEAANAVVDNGSALTAAPFKTVRELSGVLSLVRTERNKNLHTNEEDIYVKHHTLKWSGDHTLRLYGTLSSDKAYILLQARTQHCGLNACLFRKKLADSPACECGRGDVTVLHVLLRCDRYAEARKA